MAETTKFESQDLPVILAAVKKAHESQKYARVIIDFSNNGGLVGVQLETKEKLK